MFDALETGRARRLESPVVEADDAQIARKFGGRVPGARNVATVKRLEMFARISGDPVLASARILAMPTAELAAMLGTDAIGAEEFRQRERFAVMPYVISKRPLDAADTKPAPALHLHFPPASAAAPGAPVQLGAGGAVALFQAHAARGQVDILPPLESDDVSDT